MTVFYSEYGEDRFLYEAGLLPETGVFVDIGAADGVTGSNTKMLEEMGWEGLCIEADLRWYDTLSKTRKNCLMAAVSDHNGITNYYLDSDPTLGGIAPPRKKDKKEIQVPCLTLATILDHYRLVPDLISLDTEGTETDILNSFDRDDEAPKWIIIEYLTQNTDHSERIVEYFLRHP